MHTQAAKAKTAIHYQDHGAWTWLRTHAPCSWQGKVEVELTTVPLGRLQSAGSCTDPEIVSRWLARMSAGRPIPPLIVNQTELGYFYVRDGNHRYTALQELLAGDEDAEVRVALIAPKHGFQFRYRFFGSYGTYLLEAVNRAQHAKTAVLSADVESMFSGRVLVLVAHPDDETACAGLLQRLREPVVAFATEGAPTDQFFWGPFGSQQNYGKLRRHESLSALANVPGAECAFLTEWRAGSDSFTDQQLYRVLPGAFESICRIIDRYQPETIVVPAYEGGHPDHDTCSLLGSLLRRQMGLQLWEMPLYHRYNQELVCQSFRQKNGTEAMLVLSPPESRKRAAMVASYRTQFDLASYVMSPVEYYRPQPEYDYSSPPHAGALNYQVWEWPISPAEVCACFTQFIREAEEAVDIGEAHSLTIPLLEARTATAANCSERTNS